MSEILKKGTVNKNLNVIVCSFFAAFLFIGLFVYDDYGMSWDERSQWESNGHANVNYILGNDNNALLASGDKYHGPAFEIVLVIIEKTFHFSDSRSIFLMRHLITFLMFFISGIFFYRLTRRYTTHTWIALMGVTMYYLSPHIFAHSFYNTKDVVFLSLFTISIYRMIVFFDKQNFSNALLFAFFTGYTIDVRIMGIIIPFVFSAIVMISMFTKSKTYIWKYLLIYFSATCFFIFLFWPVLWDNPLHHFVGAFKEAFFYHWEMDVLYMGEVYSSSALPWHYLPFWIFVSKPIIYSLLFIAGCFFVLRLFLTSPGSFFRNETSLQVIVLIFFLPFLMVVIPKSILFDTGRHLYFLNCGFVLISVYGLDKLWTLKNKRIGMIVIAGLFLSVFNLIVDMVKIHPYQNLYFNEVLGGDMQKVKDNFELDYWGLASRAALENIAKRDRSERILVYTDHYPVILSLRILSEENRKRIRITDTVEKANYYIAGYRWRGAEEHEGQSEFYSVKVGNAKVITAFKFRKSAELFKAKGRRLFFNENDFEQQQSGWGYNTVVKPNEGAHSGMYALTVNNSVEYSDNLIIKGLDSIVGRSGLIAKSSFWCKSIGLSASAKLVVTVETAEGKPYGWKCLYELKGGTTQTWNHISSAVELPVIRSESDIIKIYLWNLNKSEIFIDDMEIELIEEINYDH
ncbi:MAG: glycosyltransferase family 39 protein [Bacteroidetes bacterium]|nr:glycosyltransferase family 39 protein [Bacteroidota bacterium]